MMLQYLSNVKVTPWIIPHAANEWPKGYIEQLLLELVGLIEPCNGPWAAAAVVLVPSNAEDRAPRRRKVNPKKESPNKLLKLNTNGKSLTVQENQVNSSYDMLIRQWPDSTFEAPAYQVADVEGYKQEITSESSVIETGKKDPY